jgi:hypothetical protein
LVSGDRLVYLRSRWAHRFEASLVSMRQHW